MNFKSKIIKALSIALPVFLIALAFNRPNDRYFEIAKNLDIFATLYKEVNALYVEEVDPNAAIKTAIDAMLASLDPYTNYIPEDDIEDFRTQSTGQYGGIGAVTGHLNGKIKVIMLMEGYSAEKNGLRIGDEIIKINDVPVEKLSREATSDLMKGQANTAVSLTVMRYGNPNPIVLEFKREKVQINSVPYYGKITSEIGYIKLSEFTMQASQEVEDALTDLKSKGIKKVILDVRNNPGGLLLEAVNISNLFIPKGKAVVSTKGKVTAHNATYSTLNKALDEHMPLVVLINSGSASASEIVAGTMQDYDRGIVIGERSYGKGLVQITRPLSYNSQLKVTTAKYYTPSGRCIQALDYTHKAPDGSVAKIPDSLQAEYTTKNGRLVYGGGGIDPDFSIEKETLAPIAYTLFTKGLIFDFATKYHYDHPEITDAKNFHLSDADYEVFKQWLLDKDYSYSSDVESNLEELAAKVREEDYYEDIEDDLVHIRTTLRALKKNDLEAYKTQVVTLLEDEIISRYYLERGAIESTFDNDRDIRKAVSILNDEDAYVKVLNPHL